jgi:hypothetical protein
MLPEELELAVLAFLEQEEKDKQGRDRPALPAIMKGSRVTVQVEIEMARVRQPGQKDKYVAMSLPWGIYNHVEADTPEQLTDKLAKTFEDVLGRRYDVVLCLRPFDPLHRIPGIQD